MRRKIYFQEIIVPMVLLFDYNRTFESIQINYVTNSWGK